MKKFLSAFTSAILTASSIAAAFPVGAADTKKVIDDFESYGNASDVSSAYKVDDSGGEVKLSLTNSSDGSKALQYDYDLDDSGYAGVTKNIGKADWSGFTGVNFLINVNGNKELTTISFVDGDGVKWECKQNLSGTKGWTEIDIPFSKFQTASSAKSPNLKGVSELSIYANENDGSIVTTTTTTPPVVTTTTTVPVIVDREGSMHVAGNKLYDGANNEFIMKGVNLPHDWYTDYTQTSINAVADLGANTVRIVLGEGSTYTKTTKEEVKNIINWCKARGLVCILELHDFTGNDDPADITVKAVNYWKEMLDVINANKDYVIVNIANEWQGTWNMGNLWADTYKTAVKSLRDAGLETAIMIDASGYGQETGPMESACKEVLEADKDKNIIFSYHMYSVVGKDENTIKEAIDGIKNQGVCLAIGEFGYWQNFKGVDERYLVDYCEDSEIGWLAWSWKGNGGYDVPLDMSNDWAGKDLTDWGAWVFCGKNGIQETSKLAYTLKGYDKEKTVQNVPDSVPDPDIEVPGPIITDKEVPVPAGELTKYEWVWGINGDPDDKCLITTTEELSNGGIRANVNLVDENYPTMITLNSDGYDLSDHKTIDFVIRNNNSAAVQANLILKVGSDWTWIEPNKPNPYIDVPGGMTEQISFDISSADLKDVKMIALRLQPSSGAVTNPVDIVSMGFDLEDGAYEDEIAEMNRPKSADYFTWSYPESSFTKTVDTSVKDGVITIEYDGITNNDGAGIQTETRPGLGKGIDFTNYDAVKATLTNKGDKDVHVTLIVKNGQGWLWAENGGTLTAGTEEGEMIVPAGKSVDVYYSLKKPYWKSKDTNWTYTGLLTDLDDVRAIAFKLYTDGTPASGTFEISNFEVLSSASAISAQSEMPEVKMAAQTVLAVSDNVKSSKASDGMYVDGKKLYTADGTEFMMRGMNIAHTWFKNDTVGAIKKSAEYGSNATRIVLADDTYAANGWQGYKDDIATVESLIQECKANGQVAIVEYHNGTGGDDTKYVDNALAYWLDMVDMLNKYTDCCILNILNEWQGTWNLPTYAPTYESAIKTLRNAGLKNVIMIDAPGWGQDANTMITNANTILNADPDKNVMFSIHMYAVAGADDATVKSHIDNALAQNICLCIGEFGCNHMMNGQIYDVAWQTIMDYCQEKSVGWLAWSWCGNGSSDYFLDLTTDQAGNTLTDWGKNVVYGKNGIQETSVKLGSAPIAPSNSGTWYIDNISLYKSDSNYLAGDSNCDGSIDMSDAVLIMQSLSNPDKYGIDGSDASHITEQGILNADCCNKGDGITNEDALAIQKYKLEIVDSLPIAS